MESALGILVLWVGITITLGRPPPRQSQSLDHSAHNLLSSRHYDPPTDTTTQTEVDTDYYSGKCHTYEGYLNDMFSTDYVENPVRNLRLDYISTNFEAVPDEKYYLTVLKTYDAYQKGLIKSVSTRTVKIHHEGIRTEVYQTAPDYVEYRLVSHSDIKRARKYFTNKLEDECGTDREEVQLSGHDLENTEAEKNSSGIKNKCLMIEDISKIKNQMKKIDVNLKPDTTYYKLVLKVNLSVQCKHLTVIEGTLVNCGAGIKTEEYFVENDHTKLRLPSIKDRRKARTFFKDRKQKTKKIQVIVPPYSSSDEGRSKADKILVTAEVAQETNSDESDSQHDLGGPKKIVASLYVNGERQAEVPLYPLKEQM